jgi:hypothetical protein
MCIRVSLQLGLLGLILLTAGVARAQVPVPEGTFPTGFGKISNSGANLPASAVLGPGPSDWACTRHGPSGLVFEVKLAGSGALRSAANTYSWRSTDSASNGGVVGNAGGGVCAGSGCDTQAYVAAVNSAALCGFTNWRLPSRRELQILSTLVGQGSGTPVSEPTYFPNMGVDGYWTGSNFAANPLAAWSLHFDTGQARWTEKQRALRVLLVR